MTATAWIAGAVGLTCIGVVLRDLLHTLLHPIGRGSLSSHLLSLGWRLGRRWADGRNERLTLVGPLLLLSVIVTWCTLLVVGWALLYWPHMPSGFSAPDDFSWEERSGLGTAIYYSMVTIATLGYGDFTATTGWLRFASAIEGLVGFILLTASITWVLSTFPVLTRQRSLAHEVELLQRSAEALGCDPLDLGGDATTALLQAMTAQVVLAESDLAHFTVSYYFTERARWASLAAAVPYLHDLACRAQDERYPPSVRYHAMTLSCAIDGFARTLHQNFLSEVEPATTRRVLAAYARDHGRAGDVVGGVV